MRYVFVDCSPNHVQMEVVDGELWISSGPSCDISTIIISNVQDYLFFCYLYFMNPFVFVDVVGAP